MKTKRCYKCQVEKTIDQFYKSSSRGIDYYCKFCRVGTAIKSQHHKDKKCSIEDCNKPHYAKTWCRMHYARWIRTGTTDRSRTAIMGDKLYIYAGKKYRHKRGYDLMRKYKMTFEEFESRSKNGCEICGDKPKINLHVDHNHKCCNGVVACGNCVRGLLCSRCNMTVEMYENGSMREDNPNRDRVIKYLEVYNAKKG
jgi:hypothetical protein